MPGASRHEAATRDVEADEPGPGHLDRALPDAFGGLSREPRAPCRPSPPARWSGLDRPAALEFSFLLSIPTMIAATGWDLLKEIHPSKAALAAGIAAAHVVMDSERWIVLLIGTGGFVHRGSGRGGVVPVLGAQARIHDVRHLPHPAGLGAADLGRASTSGAEAGARTISSKACRRAGGLCSKVPPALFCAGSALPAGDNRKLLWDVSPVLTGPPR